MTIPSCIKKYSQLHQEAGLEIKTLETVLRHQYNLRGLLKKGKGKNLGKRQRKVRDKARKVQQTQTEEELLDNRASLPPFLELLWGMWLLLPKMWLRYILKKSNCFNLYLDYLKILNKVTSCNYRIEFLKQCLNNDIIPDFLRFRAPKNEIFSEQALHSFQLKLLKQEINHAEKGRKVFKEKKLETDRSNFRENVKPELVPSVVSCIKLEMWNHSAMVQNRLNGKLD